MHCVVSKIKFKLQVTSYKLEITSYKYTVPVGAWVLLGFHLATSCTCMCGRVRVRVYVYVYKSY